MSAKILYNSFYLKFVELIFNQLKNGEEVPEELIEDTKEIGHLAGIPEEEIEILDIALYHSTPLQ